MIWDRLPRDRSSAIYLSAHNGYFPLLNRTLGNSLVAYTVNNLLVDLVLPAFIHPAQIQVRQSLRSLSVPVVEHDQMIQIDQFIHPAAPRGATKQLCPYHKGTFEWISPK